MRQLKGLGQKYSFKSFANVQVVLLLIEKSISPSAVL